MNLLKELTPHRSDDKQFLEVSRHESAGFQRCNVQGRSHAKPVCLGTTLRDKDGEYFGQTREPVILHRTLCTEKNKTHIYIYMQVYIIHVYYCSILIHRTVPVCSGLGWSILVVGVDMFVFLSVKCKGLGFNSANAA